MASHTSTDRRPSSSTNEGKKGKQKWKYFHPTFIEQFLKKAMRGISVPTDSLPYVFRRAQSLTWLASRTSHPRNGKNLCQDILR